MGYHRAGFEVVGVDHVKQPRYPFEFVQADAISVMDRLLAGGWFGGRPTTSQQWSLSHFDVIHASPPCQAFCDLKDMYNAKAHEDLLTPTRTRLAAQETPYVIENVKRAPMDATVILCGSMFGLGAEGARLQRHRKFEMNWPLIAPPCAHRRGQRVIGVYGGHGRDRRRIQNTQDFSTDARREAMGIDWMTGQELSQAIPPAYTEYIGKQLLEALCTPTTGC